MYTLYKFNFLNGISEINQLFDDILIIWPAPVYTHSYTHKTMTTMISIKSDCVESVESFQDICTGG